MKKVRIYVIYVEHYQVLKILFPTFIAGNTKYSAKDGG